MSIGTMQFCVAYNGMDSCLSMVLSSYFASASHGHKSAPTIPSRPRTPEFSVLGTSDRLLGHDAEVMDGLPTTRPQSGGRLIEAQAKAIYSILFRCRSLRIAFECVK